MGLAGGLDAGKDSCHPQKLPPKGSR
jgi:hypothetical protein